MSDGFNLESLRLNQDFTNTAGVKRLITRIPIRKPNKMEFIRIRAGDNWRFQTNILELKQDNEVYFLTPEAANEVASLLRPVSLHLAIDRFDNLFLAPVGLPGEDGKWNAWHQSMSVALKEAESQWVRVVANKKAGYYDVLTASGALSEPNWPDLSFTQILEIASKGRIINRPDHPVIQQLLGFV